jgi:membrane fusion protein, multidrug efflux system
MAESDPHFSIQAAEIGPAKPSLGARIGKVGLMLSVPLLLIGIALWYYHANEHKISTDNAYIQQDKVSVSSLVTGEIAEVLVRENQPVRAGDCCSESILSLTRSPLPSPTRRLPQRKCG